MKNRFILTGKKIATLIIKGIDFCPCSSILIDNEKAGLLKPLYSKSLLLVAIISHSAEQFVVKGKLQKKKENTKKIDSISLFKKY